MFDGNHLALGGVKLLAAGFLESGHVMAAVGLNVVDRLLEGLLLVVSRLPVVPDDSGLSLYSSRRLRPWS